MKMKYFAMIDRGEDYEDFDLYVCDNNTPIPTAKEIVARFSMNKACEHFPVVVLTQEEFLKIHNEMLKRVLDNEEADIYAPDYGELTLWEYWLPNELFE